MSELPDDATRRVVKKVVKKTIVRPAAPGSIRPAAPARTPTAAAPAPASARQRARLSTPALPQTIQPVTPAAARPAARPAAPVGATARTTQWPADTEAAADTTVHAQTALIPDTQARVAPPAAAASVTTKRFPSLPKPDVRGRASNVGHGIGDAFSNGFHAVSDRVVDAWDWLLGLRLPYLSPVKGSAITGVIVGLVCVTIGRGFYALFSLLLGTQAGGGWGFLAFVFLSFVAFAVGELLLSAFGVPHARVVSILSVLLVLLVVLVFFIRLAAGVWAWPLIPLLFALGFVASSAAIAMATKEENLQRLPWEPTEESQVRTD